MQISEFGIPDKPEPSNVLEAASRISYKTVTKSVSYDFRILRKSGWEMTQDIGNRDIPREKAARTLHGECFDKEE